MQNICNDKKVGQAEPTDTKLFARKKTCVLNQRLSWGHGVFRPKPP